MANRDSAFGAKIVYAPEAPTPHVIKTGETLAVGDLVISELGAGLTIALSNSPILYGVIVPQENASGVHKVWGENLYTTSTAGQTCWVQKAHPDLVLAMQCSGSTTAKMVGDLVDIEGATGAMECNENANTEKVLQIVKVLDNEPFEDQIVALGANGIVHVKLNPWQGA